MSPVTHFFTGWVFANCFDLERRDRAIVTWACVAPDIDGFGIVAELITRDSPHPLLWFSKYHHSLHNLLFAIVVAILSFAVATKGWKTAVLGLLSFHIHLLEDVLGSRGPDGYQWPVPYLSPFSTSERFVWHGQWGLNAWQNILITSLLLLITIWLAWRKGFSPLEMVSPKFDGEFVSTLRRRFPVRNAM